MAERGAEERGLWSAEFRATAALAWPLVLTNVAQALIHTTDVVLLGWLGPRSLAAGTLGMNIYVAFLTTSPSTTRLSPIYRSPGNRSACR